MANKANWGAKHGPVWGAVNAALGAIVFTVFTDLANTPAFWGVGVGIIVGIIAFGASRHAKLTMKSAAWRGGAWLAAGLWTWWARTHESTVSVLDDRFWWANMANWLVVVVLMLVAAVGGRWLGGQVEDPEARKARETREAQLKLAERYNRKDDTRENRLADEWEQRIARVNRIGRVEKVQVVDLAADPSGKTKTDLIDPRTRKPVVRVVDGVEIYNIEFWKDGNGKEIKEYDKRRKQWVNTGFTFEGVFPEGGHSPASIDGPSLANDARLPAGCTVRIAPGHDRGSFIGYVQLFNVLAVARPYPTDFTPKSILDGIHMGFEEHGAPKILNVAGHNTTNVGAPESGKTNASNVAGLRVVETTNALLFDIDIAGGGVTTPFLPDEWLNGDPAVPQPGVAVAAPVVELAWLVTTIGVNIIAARKSQLPKKDGKVPLGHCMNPACSCDPKGVPLLFWRIDEGWSLWLAGEIGRMARDNIEQIAGEGRPARCRVFYGALGSTDEYLPLGVGRNAPNRIALAQPDEGEIARYLGWGKDFDASIFNTAGNAAVRTFEGGSNIDVVKLFHLSDEETIRQGVRVCSPRRPVLDPVSEAAANGPIRIEHPQLVEYFRGKIDVVENGRHAETDGHWIWDGSLTITNFWKNRWLFILPHLFQDRFGNIMAEEMAKRGQAPATAQPAAAMAGSNTTSTTPRAGGTNTVVNDDNVSMGTRLKNMQDANAALADAMAAGEAAAREADARNAEKAGELGEIQEALAGDGDKGDQGGEGDQPSPAAATPLPPAPADFRVPDTIDELPEGFRLNAWSTPPAGAVPAQPAAQAVPRTQATGPALSNDPTRQRLMVLGYIVEAGAEGVSVGPLRQRLIAEVAAEIGDAYSLTEQAFRKSRIDKLIANALIHQPYQGTDEDLLAPDGGRRSHWVATDRGVRFWEKEKHTIGK